MATARLHTILQIRTLQDPQELGYLFFSINKALNTAIEGTSSSFREKRRFVQFIKLQFLFRSAVGHSEEYSFLMPVLKALLEKSRNILCLSTIIPDLPPTSSGPVFFEEFQMYSGTKQWTSFIEKQVCVKLKLLFALNFDLFLLESIDLFVIYAISKCKLNQYNSSKLSIFIHILLLRRLRPSTSLNTSFVIENKLEFY